MSIKIKSVARKNPQDLTAPPKYYAQAVNQGEISLNQLSVLIAQMSTVSKADVYAVLIALTDVVPVQLEEGKIVRLGEMGSFSIGLNSYPSELEEKVSAASVKKLNLRFRPSIELKKKVDAFSVSKIS